jgi:cysteine synthase/SAM-dependent methyltransferase
MSSSEFDRDQAAKFATGTKAYDQFSRNLVIRLATRSAAPDRVLDIGCGAGTLMQQLSAIFPASQMTGVDPSDAFLENARKNVPTATLLKGRAEELPLPDGTFDMVLSTWVLHQCHEVDRAIREAARVLRPGGEVIFCILHPLQSFMHLHDEVHASQRKTLDYWGSDTFVNPLHYGVAFEEEHHTLDAYIGAAFLQHFELLHFSEGKQQTSPNVRNVNHPSFFLLKARKRTTPNLEAIVPLEADEALQGYTKPPSTQYPPTAPNPLPAIADSVSQLIGNTPLVRTPMDEVPCELLAKLEFLNPIGSIKDRLIAAIDEAMADGRLKPGDTVIEATAGNTGIAFMAAVSSRGLKGKVLLAEKFSEAKANTLKLLGAQVVRVPNHINDQLEARAMAEREGAFHFGQFYNALNPEIHARTTAEEIWAQCQGRIDAVVAGCGTGGTLMGLTRRLKERNPNLKVVGVSPKGAKLLPDDDIGCWEIEGIGTPYSPPLCEIDAVDEWVRITDEEAFQTAHRLMVDHSIFCGSSGGGNMAGALRSHIVSALPKDARCAVILPDSAKNYPSTILNYEWMEKKGYLFSATRKRTG